MKRSDQAILQVLKALAATNLPESGVKAALIRIQEQLLVTAQGETSQGTAYHPTERRDSGLASTLHPGLAFHGKNPSKKPGRKANRS